MFDPLSTMAYDSGMKTIMLLAGGLLLGLVMLAAGYAVEPDRQADLNTTTCARYCLNDDMVLCCGTDPLLSVDWLFAYKIGNGPWTIVWMDGKEWRETKLPGGLYFQKESGGWAPLNSKTELVRGEGL